MCNYVFIFSMKVKIMRMTIFKKLFEQIYFDKIEKMLTILVIPDT